MPPAVPAITRSAMNRELTAGVHGVRWRRPGLRGLRGEMADGAGDRVDAWAFYPSDLGLGSEEIVEQTLHRVAQHAVVQVGFRIANGPVTSKSTKRLPGSSSSQGLNWLADELRQLTADRVVDDQPRVQVEMVLVGQVTALGVIFRSLETSSSGSMRAYCRPGFAVELGLLELHVAEVRDVQRIAERLEQRKIFQARVDQLEPSGGLRLSGSSGSGR